MYQAAAESHTVPWSCSKRLSSQFNARLRSRLANQFQNGSTTRGSVLTAFFTSRVRSSEHLSTRQYARLIKQWVQMLGLDPSVYGTHSMRRTKATLIYKRTKNLRAVHLLLGHTKLESTVRYLGVEVDDALEIAEQPEV